MGKFRIEIEAVGGHGCTRSARDGEPIDPASYCNGPSCPDCMARTLVKLLERKGFMDVKGLFIHWPDTESQVTDDLVNGVRHGSF